MQIGLGYSAIEAGLSLIPITLLMGLYAKLPFAVAPGMGINAYFTFTIILAQKVWWQTALGIIFWAGVLFLLISVTPVRETIARAMPFQTAVKSLSEYSFRPSIESPTTSSRRAPRCARDAGRRRNGRSQMPLHA